MEQLIEDLLALAREDELASDPEPVALASVAREAWDTVETDAATLAVEGETTVPADRSRLRQLLENLFGNAVEHGSTSPDSQPRRDAIEHGGVDVTVRVGPMEGGFYVADDGAGIPPEERDRVFERGVSTADGGIGFGLAIVERIAEAHGWTVTATESEDGGARFEVTGVEARE
jgi:signal transduction histidine kinase